MTNLKKLFARKMSIVTLVAILIGVPLGVFAQTSYCGGRIETRCTNGSCTTVTCSVTATYNAYGGVTCVYSC